MKKSFKVLLRLFSCMVVTSMLLVSPASAQDSGSLTVVIDDIDVSDYENSQTTYVYVTVRHVKGRPAEDLTQDNFTLSISGGSFFVPDKAELVDDGPVSMGIVLELYKSMSGKPLTDAKTAINTLCREDKKENDRCALFAVREDVDPDDTAIDDAYEMLFTHDGGAVANFAQGLQVVNGKNGGTPLYDTLIRAINFTAKVSKEPPGRRAIVVITDGGDRGSMYTAQNVIDTANALRVPIFAIGYTGGNQKQHEDLKGIAVNTLGDYKDAPSSEDFSTFLTDTRYQLSRRYRLTINREIPDGRQILDVRATISGLHGTDSQPFDIIRGVTPVPTLAPSATPGADEPTPTEEAAGGEDTPEPTEEPDDGETDPMLLMAIGGGVLAVILIVILIVALARRKKQQQANVYTDTGEGWHGDLGNMAGTAPGQTLAPTSGGATEIAEPWQPGTAATAHTQTPGVPGISPPVAGMQPPGPVPGGYHGAAPSPQGGTVIIDRGPKMAHYAMLVSQQARLKYDIDKPMVNIGRAEQNHICLDGEKISRQHASIKLEGDVFRIYDLGSANGTFVNDVQVRAPVALKDGDRVRFGNMEFIFKPIS